MIFELKKRPVLAGTFFTKNLTSVAKLAKHLACAWLSDSRDDAKIKQAKRKRTRVTLSNLLSR